MERIAAREGIPDLNAAMERVRQDDEVHSKYVARFYNKQWNEPANFDLVLDTSEVSLDDAVKRIVEAARERDRKAASQDQATSASLEVDPVLADAVRKAMSGQLPEMKV